MAPDWTAKSLALHTQAVIQGVFVLAKGTGRAEIAADSIDHLRRYIEMLFGVGNEQELRSAAWPPHRGSEHEVSDAARGPVRLIGGA